MDYVIIKERGCNLVWHHPILEFGDRSCWNESKRSVGTGDAMKAPVK